MKAIQFDMPCLNCNEIVEDVIVGEAKAYYCHIKKEFQNPDRNSYLNLCPECNGIGRKILFRKQFNNDELPKLLKKSHFHVSFIEI